MPVSHLTLTVSHLPTSTSFFLACLQPLGYKFIGRHDEYIGFGSKADEPADFWLAQEQPGTPVGAAHIAFPAATKEAVNAFFISALKAGGKIHGEPRVRDAETGYFSAAIVDFDGNSIEAVYRPDSNGNSSNSVISSSRSATVRGPSALQTIKNGSVVSRARSIKAESVVSMSQDRSVHAIENISPSRVKMLYDQQQQLQQQPAVTSYQSQPQQGVDNSNNLTAKTIIGTLIGATAGAAIAYAMMKGDSSPLSSSAPTNTQAPASAPSPIAIPSPSQYIQQQPQPQPQPPQQQLPRMAMSLPALMPILGPAPGSAPTFQDQPPSYRALEGPPTAQARSTFTANDAISAFSRSTNSKNKSPRADTIYEETEYYPTVDGSNGGIGGGAGAGSVVYSQEPSTNGGAGIRRTANGSVYATGDMPIRAIEYSNGRMSVASSNASSQKSARSKSYPCDPSSFISSYAETQQQQRQQQGHILDDIAETEFSSISTIKPSKSKSHRSSASSTPPSSMPSYYEDGGKHGSTHSVASSHRSKSSSKHSHYDHHRYADVDEPTVVYGGGSTASSTRTAHKVPLPDSRVGSTYSIPHSSASKASSKRSSAKDRTRDINDNYSAHEIPLPESVVGPPSTVYLDTADIDSDVTPDDSVSQIGINHNHNENKSSSGRSHRSKSSPSSNVSPPKREKDVISVSGSSIGKFEQILKPSDSVSQVSSNHHHASSRVSERTIKAGSKVHSRSGSKISGHY